MFENVSIKKWFTKTTVNKKEDENNFKYLLELKNEYNVKINEIDRKINNYKYKEFFQNINFKNNVVKGTFDGTIFYYFNTDAFIGDTEMTLVGGKLIKVNEDLIVSTKPNTTYSFCYGIDKKFQVVSKEQALKEIIEQNEKLIQNLIQL